VKLFVVVPVYNEAVGIRPTLEALEAQTDSDFDVIFVDNGSTDEGLNWATRLALRPFCRACSR